MKKFRVSPVAIAILLVALCVTMNSANASPRTRQRSYPNQPKVAQATAASPQPTLDDAVMAVQAQSGGRILSARKILYKGASTFEIKVMREGRVEVIRVRSSSSN